MTQTHHKERFYFRIIDEEDETTDPYDCAMECNAITPIDSSLNQTDIDDICLSIIDSNNSYPFESPLEIVANGTNSNVDNGVQNCVVIDLSDDDEETRPLETAAPLVNITDIHLIPVSKNQKKLFPTYDKKMIFNLMMFLSDKTENYAVNLQSTHGYQLRVRHLMDLLSPNAWLKDVIIYNYLLLVGNCCKNTLVTNTDFLLCYELRGYESVSKWYDSKQLINITRVVIPINPDKNHWAVFIIDLWEGKVYYFDSLKDRNIEKELKLVSDYFDNALSDCVIGLNVARTLPAKWNFVQKDTPIQTNNTDCGIFTCMSAKYFLFNRHPKFTQKDIPILRQIIAWELINNILEPF